MLRILTALIVLATGVASARTLNCSTADQHISFTFDATDGGAPRPDIVVLKIGGKVAPKETKIEFVEKTTHLLSKRQIHYNVYRTFTQVIRVTTPDSKAPMLADHAICRQRNYVGPPIPSTPPPGPGKGGISGND